MPKGGKALHKPYTESRTLSTTITHRRKGLQVGAGHRPQRLPAVQLAARLQRQGGWGRAGQGRASEGARRGGALRAPGTGLDSAAGPCTAPRSSPASAHHTSTERTHNTPCLPSPDAHHADVDPIVLPCGRLLQLLNHRLHQLAHALEAAAVVGAQSCTSCGWRSQESGSLSSAGGPEGWLYRFVPLCTALYRLVRSQTGSQPGHPPTTLLTLHNQLRNSSPGMLSSAWLHSRRSCSVPALPPTYPQNKQEEAQIAHQTCCLLSGSTAGPAAPCQPGCQTQHQSSACDAWGPGQLRGQAGGEQHQAGDGGWAAVAAAAARPAGKHH